MSTPSQLHTSLKSKDTEENIDIYFTRPIGLLWAKLFIALHIHPNIVTLLSIFIGMAGGWCMIRGNDSWTYTMTGILLLIWANIYDSTDGQMARITGQKTRWGRILDGFAGDVWFVCIYFAIGWRLMEVPIFPFWKESPLWSVWIFVGLYFLGFHIHAVQSRLADYYRNIHLYFLKGVSGSELDSSVVLQKEYETLRWRDRFAWKLFLHFYCKYTQGQERDTPMFQKLKHELDKRYGRSLPEEVVASFRKGSLPLMKWANFISFNWRAITLYIALIGGIYNPGVLILYPMLELTLFHFVYLYMRSRHEKLCHRLLTQLQEAQSSSTSISQEVL